MRFRLRRVYKRIRRRANPLNQRIQIVPLMVLALLFLSLSLSGYHLLLKENGLDHSMAKSVLHLGMPSVPVSSEGGELQFQLASFIYWLTNYDLQDPLHIVEATLPFAPGFADLRLWEDRPFVFIQELSFAPDPVRPAPSDSADQKRQDAISTPPKVLIYHTHSSEMYLGRAVDRGSSQPAHYVFRNQADPTITGVMAVGRHLSNALTRLGISNMHETRIHTLPTINNSYSNSEKTVRDILGKQHDFEVVIDLHRDAGVPNPTVVIDGKEVARIALVVGTADRIPLAHPNYQNNVDFAYKLKSICDKIYPGLVRPVQIHREARYNQHLHPASVIVELGSVDNTLEEALLAAELLANVLVRVL